MKPGVALTSEDAAERLVMLVLRATFDDLLNMTDSEGLDNTADLRERTRAYEMVESAVRRELKIVHRLDSVEAALQRVVPKEHLPQFNALSDAIGDELTVVRQAGYVVGRAVGRSIYSAHLEALPPKPRPR
jgi:hypothetical protein